LVGSGMLFLKLIVARMPCLTRMVGPAGAGRRGSRWSEQLRHAWRAAALMHGGMPRVWVRSKEPACREGRMARPDTAGAEACARPVVCSMENAPCR